jgi:NAD+ synthase
MRFDKDSLQIDSSAEAARLTSWLSESVRVKLHRRGAIVGVSGGVDSAVVLALCVRALGQRHVLAVILPERESAGESEPLARRLAAKFGVETAKEDITAALEGLGCYRRRDEAIKRVIPEYNPSTGDRAKLVLPQHLLDDGALNVFSIVIVKPDGSEISRPLPTNEYLQVVAASNFKQRTRMAMLYYYAESRHFAVIGTANRNERQQGFFVKHGDAGVDCDPIAHLYKTQVYQLAEHLEIPEEIRRRAPTSDTYSAPCTQEEFFFRLPFSTMDILWDAEENDVPAAETAEAMGLTQIQVERAYEDFRRKARATQPLREPPLCPPATPMLPRAGH